MTGWWRRWKRARTLARRAIPEPLWRLTLARFPFLADRGDVDIAELRELTTLFLAAKEFTGARGLVVTDEMAVAIAAQACLPALRLGLHWYDRFVGIVVHEDAVVARRQSEGDDGVVHAYDEELSGEAMSGGPVMLAWRAVDAAGESAAAGYNVVVHEFAHVIDMHAGVTAAPGDADQGTDRGRWVLALEREWRRFTQEVDAGEEPFLDPYGAEALEEFFAVSAEAFFVAPLVLKEEEPLVYELLRTFFGQDPASGRA